MCLLDPRSLEEHPDFEHYRAVLERGRSAAAVPGRGGGRGGAVAGGAAAGRGRRGPVHMSELSDPPPAGDGKGKAAKGKLAAKEKLVDAVPESDPEESEQEKEEEEAEVVDLAADEDGSGDGGRSGSGKQQAAAAAASKQPPRAFPLRPPPGASGPLCALCCLATLLEGDPLGLGSEEEQQELRRDFAGLYGRDGVVVHKRCATSCVAFLRRGNKLGGC